MEQMVYTIYDEKAEAYLPPWYAPTKAVALRSFARAVQDEHSDFHHHAADYTLFEIGTWDQAKGHLTMHDAKINLGCAIEYVNASPASNGALTAVGM